MSFILDALKKVEREKRAQDALDRGELEAEEYRSWPSPNRRMTLALAGVSLTALAALALAGLAFLRDPVPEPPAAGGSGHEGPAAPPVRGSPSPDRAAEAGDEGGDPLALESQPAPIPLAPAAEAAEDESSGPPADAPGEAPTAGSAASSEEPVEEPDRRAPLPDPPVEEPPSSPPVRLVGRDALGAGMREPAPMRAEPIESAGDVPRLVLQGTSIVDGQPIAVINYKRVFEGDIIDGAQVIKILDRSIELEFQGRRFTLQL